MFKLKKGLEYLGLGLILLILLPVLVLANPVDSGVDPDHWKTWFFPDSAVSGENVVVPSGKTVKGPAFYAGTSVRILGTIDGTAFVAGKYVTVDGVINGDLFIAGQKVTVNGKVMGNLYGAGQDVKINGPVSGDVFGAGKDIEIDKGAAIERDMILGGETILLSGQVGRQLFAGGSNLEITGTIHDNVKLYAEKLSVQDETVVGGNLLYSSPNKGFISDHAQISGKTEWKKVVPKTPEKQKTWTDDFLGILWSLAAALLIWFIVKVWRPQLWDETARTISAQPLKTLGTGALVLILTPILALILMITVIGIPLGIILALMYGVSIYLAKIIVGVLIGTWLAQKFSWPQLHKGVWLVLLGLAVYTVLVKLPVVGFLFVLLTIFAGLGSLVLAFGSPIKAGEEM